MVQLAMHNIALPVIKMRKISPSLLKLKKKPLLPLLSCTINPHNQPANNGSVFFTITPAL
jgi:hypothetical protein